MVENKVEGTDCLAPGGSSFAWGPSPKQNCYPAVLWATGFWVGGSAYGLCTVIFWIRCDCRRSYLGLRAGQVRVRIVHRASARDMDNQIRATGWLESGSF